MDTNQLFHHTQHGAIKGKSTSSALLEIQDQIKTAKNQGTNIILLAIDQSLAYDIVCHQILLRKIKVIGFGDQMIQLIQDYLTDRKQIVQVNSHQSSPRLTGPISVSQGSVLSCIFFLIYTLYMAEIFHTTRHNIERFQKCPQPSTTQFVDDASVLIKETKDQTLQQSLDKTFSTINTYLQTNGLSQNKEKKQIYGNHQKQKL